MEARAMEGQAQGRKRQRYQRQGCQLQELSQTLKETNAPAGITWSEPACEAPARPSPLRGRACVLMSWPHW